MASNINTTTDNQDFIVETDADPVYCEEDDQTIPQGEDHILDNNVFSKARTRQDAAASAHTEPTSQSHGNTFNKLLPHHLREDYYIDLLLIHSDADYDDAKAFKKFVQKKVTFCEDLTPNVALYRDVITDFPFHQLDQAFSRSMYILMYVTEDFCEDIGKLSESHTCLLKAFNSPKESKAIIPVHTCSKQSRSYQLPMMLENLRALNYFNKKLFTQDVIRLLEHKSDLILTRNYKLEMARQEYLKANHDELNLKQSNPDKEVKSPVRTSETTKREKLERAQSYKDSAEARVKDAGLEHQLQSQFSVSTKPKFIVDSRNVESDGDVPKCRRNPQQNDQQRNRTSDTSLAKDMVDNESGYNSYAAEESTWMNYSSLPEYAGDKAEPTNLPAQIRSTNSQAAFSGKQNLSNTAGCDKPLPKVQSVNLDTNENLKGPSTDDEHARKMPQKMGSTKSPNRLAPVYNIHINHADVVSINSIMKTIKDAIDEDLSDEDI